MKAVMLSRMSSATFGNNSLGTAIMRLLGAHMTTASLPACSSAAVTYITWSRDTLNIYNNNSTSCNDVIVFYHARESCALGRRKSFLRKAVAIFFFQNRELVCSKTGCPPQQKPKDRHAGRE